MTNVSRTEIVIPASSAAIWSVLTDLPAYPNWNPFIRRAEGAGRAGARWRLELTMNGRSFLDVRTIVTCWEPGRRLTWRGGLPLPGLLTGSHDFRLEPVPGAVRFVQEETFKGVLVPAFLPWLRARTQDQFGRMNAALAVEVERRRRLADRVDLDGEAPR